MMALDTSSSVARGCFFVTRPMLTGTPRPVQHAADRGFRRAGPVEARNHVSRYHVSRYHVSRCAGMTRSEPGRHLHPAMRPGPRRGRPRRWRSAGAAGPCLVGGFLTTATRPGDNLGILVEDGVDLPLLAVGSLVDPELV